MKKLIELAKLYLKAIEEGAAFTQESKNAYYMLHEEPRIKVYRAIDSERDYQNEKWTGHEHEVGAYITMLDYYVTEAKQGWVKNSGDKAALESIRKIAGIAVACMEAHGAPLRETKAQKDSSEFLEYHNQETKCTCSICQDKKREGTAIMDGQTHSATLGDPNKEINDHGPFIVGYLNRDQITVTYIRSFENLPDASWKVSISLDRNEAQEFTDIFAAKKVAATLQAYEGMVAPKEPRIQVQVLVKNFRLPKNGHKSINQVRQELGLPPINEEGESAWQKDMEDPNLPDRIEKGLKKNWYVLTHGDQYVSNLDLGGYPLRTTGDPKFAIEFTKAEAEDLVKKCVGIIKCRAAKKQEKDLSDLHKEHYKQDSKEGI